MIRAWGCFLYYEFWLDIYLAENLLMDLGLLLLAGSFLKCRMHFGRILLSAIAGHRDSLPSGVDSCFPAVAGKTDPGNLIGNGNAVVCIPVKRKKFGQKAACSFGAVLLQWMES